MSGLQSRLSDFKSRFSNLLGGRGQGYEELSALERPLVGGADEDDERDRYQAQAGAQYRPPAVLGPDGAPVPGNGGSFTAASGPSQVDELQEVTVLSKDAAEILWEMVALGETGPAHQEMRANAEQLRAQLRGLIGDYTGGDETIFAAAFEAFDMITRCLDGTAEAEVVAEQEEREPAPPASAPAPVTVTAPPVVAAAAAPIVAPIVPAAPAAPAPVLAEEPPLISFD